MVAVRRGRRVKTAREAAAALGVTPRTIRNYVAMERGQWEAEARARHERIRALRAEGMTYRAIAAEVGCSIGTVHYAMNRPQEAPEGP